MRNEEEGGQAAFHRALIPGGKWDRGNTPWTGAGSPVFRVTAREHGPDRGNLSEGW